MKSFLNLRTFVGCLFVLLSCQEKPVTPDVKTLYKAAPKGVVTRWASAENPNALKGKGGMSNKGAKGDAYTLIAPNSTKVIFDQKGAGIITKIWSGNSIRFKKRRWTESSHQYVLGRFKKTCGFSAF